MLIELTENDVALIRKALKLRRLELQRQSIEDEFPMSDNLESEAVANLLTHFRHEREKSRILEGKKVERDED
jgi:hypothetical protein